MALSADEVPAFHASIQWSVLLHTAVGLATLIPVTWYFLAHWRDYKSYNFSDEVLLGYVATVALVVCAFSGLLLTWQGLFELRTSALWRNVHLYSTLAALVTSLPHVLIVFFRRRSRRQRLYRVATALVALGLASALAGFALYRASRPDVRRPGEDLPEITDKLSKGLPPGAPSPRFTDVTAAAGLDGFVTFAGTRSSQLPEDMGSGLAWGDFDNDGDDDLFAVSAGGALTLPPEQRAPSVLFENLAGAPGNVTFRKVVDFPEIRIPGMAAAWGDYDALYDSRLAQLREAAAGAAVRLIFSDLAVPLGLGHPALHLVGWGTEFADFDGDGWLDLVVANGSTLEDGRGAAIAAQRHAGRPLVGAAAAQPGRAGRRATGFRRRRHRRRPSWGPGPATYPRRRLVPLPEQPHGSLRARHGLQGRKCGGTLVGSELFREALALDPKHEDSRYYLANCLAQLGHIDEALAELDQLRRDHPQSHRAHKQWGVLRAVTAVSAADLDAARMALERALEINREETGSLLVLGEIALLQADDELADQRLEWACRTNPKAVGGFFLRAYLAWKRREVDAAARLLETAREARGKDWKPEGTVAEGDVARRMHRETTPLAASWETWDGSVDPAPAFQALDDHLTTSTVR